MEEGRDAGGGLGGRQEGRGRAEGEREAMAKSLALCITLPFWLLLPSTFYRDMDCQHIQGREQCLTYVLYRDQVLHSTYCWESTLCLTPPLWLLLPLMFCRDMDRQHIQDREKWKRETAQKIKETKVRGTGKPEGQCVG